MKSMNKHDESDNEKPQKIYCSYWVRKGECDFEQQGKWFTSESKMQASPNTVSQDADTNTSCLWIWKHLTVSDCWTSLLGTVTGSVFQVFVQVAITLAMVAMASRAGASQLANFQHGAHQS
jgi:hypothetical protein